MTKHIQKLFWLMRKSLIQISQKTLVSSFPFSYFQESFVIALSVFSPIEAIHCSLFSMDSYAVGSSYSVKPHHFSNFRRSSWTVATYSLENTTAGHYGRSTGTALSDSSLLAWWWGPRNYW